MAILGVLAAGAAYVPVDADDPDERAELVFGEADVCAVLGDGLARDAASRTPAAGPAGPDPDDDAWIIFTSGSTGTPEGRGGHATGAAAAFVDAEARLFLADDAPIGPRRPGARRACRWRSTRPARRCGSPGGTAPAWCRRRARWCAAASTSARGWSSSASPSCRRCRRWPRCGRSRRSTTSGC